MGALTNPMKTTSHPTHEEPVVQSNQPSTRRLVRSGALAGAIAAPDDTATKVVLVGTHLLAAAIIIPTLSQRLIAVNNDRSPRGDRTDAGQQPGLSDPRCNRSGLRR
jgi:hypothetical protein